MKYFNTIYAHSMRCLRFVLYKQHWWQTLSCTSSFLSQPNARRDVTQHSVNAENSLETHIKNFKQVEKYKNAENKMLKAIYK